MKPQLYIIIGAYGSGKSEYSIHLARSLKAQGLDVVLADLDVVNPYFRSREQRELLAPAGINVLASVEEYFNTDLPALSPAISGVLQDTGGFAVIDVGGDETGARALGRYHNLLPAGSYNLFFAVNPFRPFTRDVEGISKVLKEVEQASRLKVTALVSNPNLGPETGPTDILTGPRTIMEASGQINLPIAFLCIPINLAQSVEFKGIAEPVFPIKLFMLPPWVEK